MPVSFALSPVNDGRVVGKRQDSMNSKNRWVPNLVEGQTDEDEIMKVTMVLKAAVSMAIFGTALAGCGGTPERDCTNVPGAVVGGVVGGAVGSQVGSGRGRDVAIGVGAGTGAVVGSNAGC
jgi:uncharacterized protein YcfJ